MLDEAATAALAGTRFADVRWVAETGSTNADAMALARDGAAEGVVLVADHQTAGRGRQGRSWTAPPGASLLTTILLRPPAAVAGLVTMAVAVAASAAVEEVAGFRPRLKWPNDLVWPGDGSGPDRKLAGILAEADWPARSPAAAGWQAPSPDERAVVVVGVGLNVSWPDELPPELADIAIACNHIAARNPLLKARAGGGAAARPSEVGREAVLVAMLRHLDPIYGQLVRDRDGAALLAEWRSRSATIGRRVRVELGAEDLVGTAVDVTAEGHLVVEGDDGARREVAVGDVVHLRDG